MILDRHNMLNPWRHLVMFVCNVAKLIKNPLDIYHMRDMPPEVYHISLLLHSHALRCAPDHVRNDPTIILAHNSRIPPGAGNMCFAHGLAIKVALTHCGFTYTNKCDCGTPFVQCCRADTFRIDM